MIIVVSAITSLAGLLGIYILSYGNEIQSVRISEIGSDDIGSFVKVDGFVSSSRNDERGHIFLTISDGESKIQVPIFSDLASYLETRRFPVGSKVSISGVVGEYRGDMQIVPKKPEDIILVGR